MYVSTFGQCTFVVAGCDATIPMNILITHNKCFKLNRQLEEGVSVISAGDNNKSPMTTKTENNKLCTCWLDAEVTM